MEKVTAIGGVMEFKDTTNTRYSYGPSGVGEFENYTPRRNMTLPTVIPLQTPFTDPEVPYNIEDIIDLWKYMGRVQGPDDNTMYVKSLWPLGIFTDTANAPQQWKQYINNAVNIVKDSIGIQADSILIIKDQYTDPFSGQQFSAINILYMDSTEFKNHWGYNIYAGGGFCYSGPEHAFTGYLIYLNTEKITNPIDAQKYTLRHIQKYITQTTNNINNTNYLGQTGNTSGPGPATTYNQEEKKQIKIIRNFTQNIWINKLFKPGTQYKQEAPEEQNIKQLPLVGPEWLIKPDNTTYEQIHYLK